MDSGFLQVRSREAYQKLGIFVRQAAGLLGVTFMGLSILVCLYFTWVHVYSIGSQEILGVTGKFDLGVQNEAGQRLIEFCQENALVIVNTFFQQHKRSSTHGHHQMVNTEIRLIIFCAAKVGEALYRQQKQDWEVTVAQIMNSFPNSDLN